MHSVKIGLAGWPVFQRGGISTIALRWERVRSRAMLLAQ